MTTKKIKVGVVTGCFDLTHAGHYLFFKECKQFCDNLWVFVSPDEGVRLHKGNNRPIQNEDVRLFQVECCKFVDYAQIKYITLDSALNDLINIKKDMKVGNIEAEIIYMVNEDAYELDKRREFCKQQGITIKVLRRWCPPNFEEISTTKIIQKIANGLDAVPPLPAPTYEQLKWALESLEEDNRDLKNEIYYLNEILCDIQRE